jgi:hypothetical protein
VPTVALAPWVARRERELRRWLARPPGGAPAAQRRPVRSGGGRCTEHGHARFREAAPLAMAMAVEDGEEDVSASWKDSATAATVIPFAAWPRRSPGRSCVDSWRWSSRISGS